MKMRKVERGKSDFTGGGGTMKDWRYTTTRGFQLESVSSVCGRTTYFALGQSRQSRPGAGKFPCGVPAPGPLVPKLRLGRSLPRGTQPELSSVPP